MSYLQASPGTGGGSGPFTGITGTPTEVAYFDLSGNGTSDSNFTTTATTFNVSRTPGTGYDGSLSITDNTFGFGIPGIVGYAQTAEGYNGFLAVDASLFGGGQNQAFFGFFNPFGGPAAEVQTRYDVGSDEAQLDINVEDSLTNRSRIQINSRTTGTSAGVTFYAVNASGSNSVFAVRDSGGDRLLFLDNDGNLQINNAWYLPNADGSAGQALLSNGSGQAYWGAASGGSSLTQNYIGFGDAFNSLKGDASYQYLLSDFQVLQTIPSNTGNGGTTTPALAFGPASFVGSGLDDLTLTWNNATYLSKKYGGNLTIQITANGASDEFFWNYTGPYSEWIGTGSGVIIMPGPISLLDNNGNLIAQVEFASTTGHTVGDTWTAGTTLSLMPWGHVITDSGVYNSFEIRPAYGRFSIGDASGGMSLAGNGTNITVNDLIAQTSIYSSNGIEFTTNSPFNVSTTGSDTVFRAYPSARQVIAGDVSNSGNSTKLTVDDNARRIFSYAYDSFNNLYQMEVDGTSQYARLYAIDGVAYTSTVSVNTTSSSLNFQDSVSGTQNVISVAPFSSLMTSVGPTSTTSFATQAGTVTAYNGAGNESLNIDTELYKLTLGDIDAGANSTSFLIDDPNSQISARTDGSFFVADNLANLFLTVDIANGLYRMGDIDASANGTVFDINDTTGFVTVKSDGTFLVTDTFLNERIRADASGGSIVIQLGDISGTNTGTVFTVEADNYLYKLENGIIRGNDLHNNGNVSQGSATQQDVRSGTYTPTLTNVTNISSSTAYKFQWMRVGNVVTVSGRVNITNTATGASELGISLPVASDIGATTDCVGSAPGSSSGILDDVGWVVGDATNDRASMQSTATNTNPHSHWVSFTYEVI